MKVYADNYNEILYNKYPKKLEELVNYLSKILDLFKECYLAFNYYDVGTRYFIFNDLLRKFETCLFKAKEKFEKQKKYFSIKKKACDEYNTKKRILDDEYSKYDFVKAPSLWDSYKNVLSNINIERYVKILKCYKSLLHKEYSFYKELSILIEKIHEGNNFSKLKKR